MIAILPAAAAAFFSRSSRRAVPLTVFLAGSSSMAFSIVVLLAYQSMFGYLYVSLGFLTALFMAGIAVGGYVLRNAGPSLPRLTALQAGAAAIFLSPVHVRSRDLLLRHQRALRDVRQERSLQRRTSCGRRVVGPEAPDRSPQPDLQAPVAARSSARPRTAGNYGTCGRARMEAIPCPSSW
jgi:hypothetical protein